VIVVAGDQAGAVAGLARQRKRLAAAARAEVDDRLAGPRLGEEARELRALVLDLVPALQEFRLDVERRPAPVGADRDAQALRREGRRRAVQMAERRQRRRAVLLQRVQADVEGRPARQRLQLGQKVVAEETCEVRQHPFGHVARHMERRLREAALVEPRALLRAQRLGREALAGEELRDRGRRQPLLQAQRADQHGAGRLIAHDPGRGGAAAERVVDEARDRGPVARAGEAVGEPPILERVGGRSAAGRDVGQDLDGGGAAGGGCQVGLL
jgi:hypothetical protein